MQVSVDLKRDVAVLPFSSGTTGVPKGVMLSQHNLVVNVATVSGELNILPFFNTWSHSLLICPFVLSCQEESVLVVTGRRESWSKYRPIMNLWISKI